MDDEDPPSSSIFTPPPQHDAVSFSIYPDFALPQNPNPNVASLLHDLHLRILQTLAPLTASYLWHHAPFTLTPSALSTPPHLRGSLRFGDCLDDEWFLASLLLRLSAAFPDLSVALRDTDGDFLLIEAAYHLPRWLTPRSSANRAFLRAGALHIVPKNRFPCPTLIESLAFLADPEGRAEALAGTEVQAAVMARVGEYPDKARRNMHRVRVRVPAAVAQVLKHEPCLVAAAVEGFYDRDVDTMRHAAAMGRFCAAGRAEEVVTVGVVLSRAMYAQLSQQAFQAPRCYPMPERGDPGGVYGEAELGMKIACGFEMMYQQRKKEGEEGGGSTWEAFRVSLEESGYFKGLLPGSKEYKQLMESAQEYYRGTSSFSRARYWVS